MCEMLAWWRWHGNFRKLDTLLQRIDVETTSLVDLLRYLLLVA